MSAFVMSDEYPKLCKAIENFGYDIIPSDKILQFNTCLLYTSPSPRDCS